MLIKRYFLGLACCVGLVSIGLAVDPVQYALQVLEQPRSMHVHVLRVALDAPGVSLHVALAPEPPPDQAGNVIMANPLVLARDAALDWAINTNPWHGVGEPRQPFPLHPDEPAGIIGWAVADGQTRNPPRPNRWSMWVDLQGRVHIGKLSEAEAQATGALHAFSGSQRLLHDGRLVAGEPSGDLAPRTALGLARDGAELVLVVVDKGRVAGLPGWRDVIDLHELARLMLELGCHDAVNLDGGGSSILIRRVQDAPEGARWEVMNTQSRWFQRALPMVFGVRLAQEAHRNSHE